MKFKPEDFKSLEISTHGAENCARIANARLAEMLVAAPTVYGHQEDPDQVPCGGWWKWDELLEPTTHTHTAKLVQVEPIGEGEK